MNKEIKIYIGITTLMLIDLILYITFDISFRGNSVDRIILWVWFISTFYIVFKNIKRIWAKIYGGILIVLIGLSLLPMMIPFLTIIGFALVNQNSVKIDSEIQIRETSKSVIAKPYIYVLKNYWIFEREIGQTRYDFEINDEFFGIDDAKSIKRLPDSNDKKIWLEFEFYNGKVLREI
ncbi:hypothetical protein ATO12_03625 [Aquimarina atlantica]|uniref:Uncharacterized protein n=1 Tax=Aquimarina atlantica TaxID=1317122 RepID=A0A023C1U1_9FLAO|nr:hypothetical protein [Aquimarina atlantica]EZH75893.1 hypothetical protein ATO12_03625 [Aquimarina atlantica]